MAYALEPDGILFTSESTGIVEAGLAINTPILKSFADAKASLDKCKAYGARYICLPHFGLIPQDFNEEYWDRFEQGCEDRIQTVSYTHLDVYKRQAGNRCMDLHRRWMQGRRC